MKHHLSVANQNFLQFELTKVQFQNFNLSVKYLNTIGLYAKKTLSRQRLT